MTRTCAHILLLVAALLLPGCGKIVPDPSDRPLVFTTTVAGTKAVDNKSMGVAYDENEVMKVFAWYHAAPFDEGGVSAGTEFMGESGVVCSYDGTLKAWKASGGYYWPKAGYLTFQAFSPADATFGSFSHSWSTGFSMEFTVPAAGSQYDLLYTDLIKDRESTQYTSNTPYEEIAGDRGAYKGIDLPFQHALSLIEVQAVNGLGSGSPTQFYIQKIQLVNVFNHGTFSNAAWDVNTTDPKQAYTALDLSGATPPDDWKKLPGGEEAAASIHPATVLMLMPQSLDHDGNNGLNTATDAYLHIEYKKISGAQTLADVAIQTGDYPLGTVWEKGKKYIYRLVFSDFIEFEASIQRWDDEIIGSYTIN